MKLSKKLYNQHLFILKAYDVTKNVAIYKTAEGPIFCIFGSSKMVKKYITTPGGAFLISLDCSHDLSKGTSSDQFVRLYNILSTKFPGRDVSLIMNKLIRLTEKLMNMEFDADMERRVKQWKPTISAGLTFKQLTEGVSRVKR